MREKGEWEDYPMWNISSCLCAIEQNADKILIVYDQQHPKVVVAAECLVYHLSKWVCVGVNELLLYRKIGCIQPWGDIIIMHIQVTWICFNWFMAIIMVERLSICVQIHGREGLSPSEAKIGYCYR